MEDIIFKRRSIRLFKKQEIPEEILRKILLAGMWAPSPKKPAALEDNRCSGKIEGNNAPAHERGD